MIFFLQIYKGHVTWGITLTFIDCADLYIEKFSSFTEYLYKEEVKQATVYEEEIKIKVNVNQRFS